MVFDLQHICNQFLLPEKDIGYKRYGSGHINDTFKITGKEKNYLLQRVNHHVFENVEGLMRNFEKLISFFESLTLAEMEGMTFLKLFHTVQGKTFYRDSMGNFWRMMNYVEDSNSYDHIEDPGIALEGGRAWGWFVRALDGFPVDQLEETIPEFHNAIVRIGNFKIAIEQDISNRAAGVKDLIHQLIDRESEMYEIIQAGKENRIPLRVTHNDTKINNILFNKDHKAICVIDLDTVMPGYVHYDFGDAVRTFTNSADEDEKDPAKVSMNPELFKLLATGFVEKSRDILQEEEIKLLAYSARYITYEQTIRFLTDYLNGDQYYKTHYPKHNLVRTNAQFALLKSIEQNFNEMEKIIKEL